MHECPVNWLPAAGCGAAVCRTPGACVASYTELAPPVQVCSWLYLGSLPAGMVPPPSNMATCSYTQLQAGTTCKGFP